MSCFQSSRDKCADEVLVVAEGINKSSSAVVDYRCVVM